MSEKDILVVCGLSGAVRVSCYHLVRVEVFLIGRNNLNFLSIHPQFYFDFTRPSFANVVTRKLCKERALSLEKPQLR